jgi:hypothetical protein
VPVATVACEPGRLDRDHDSDAHLTDGGQQLLEAGPLDATTGAAEIVIDDGNIAPSPAVARELYWRSLLSRLWATWSGVD